MYCPSCGSPNAEGNQFCVRCRNPLPPPRPYAGAYAGGYGAPGPQAAAPRMAPRQAPLDFGVVFPLRTWMADKPWNLPWVRFFAFFAFFPLVLRRLYHGALTLENTAWAFGLYFSFIWGMILRQSMRATNVAVREIVATAIATVVLVTVYMQVASVVGFSQFQENWTNSRDLVVGTLANILLVGVVEELLKAAPLIVAFLQRGIPTTPRAAAFLGGVSGLAFGVAEAVQYSFMYSQGQQSGRLNYGSYLAVQLLRFISSPLLHALWASVTGYFVGLAATFPARSRALVVMSIGAMATIHGLFDEFSDSWLSIVICLFSLILFVGYSRTADQIMERLHQEEAAHRC
jgi:RsiW-degrading membrane proteinase PrsW (M82 family)